MKTNKIDQKKMRKDFVSSLYNTLEGVVSPTPYLEVKEGDNVDVKFLNGKGRLPTLNSTEVNVLDIDTASMFFDDFHVLYEGVTGVGKTYTSDALFNTVFGREGEGWATIRLGGSGVLANNDPTDLWRHEVKFNDERFGKIDPSKLSKYGAVFIDEINVGDPEKTFQVVDGKLKENGGNYDLQIPIPGKDGEYKGVAILAAMNPSDAEHNHARELTIAGENRFLKFKFPNGVAEAGSSQLEKILSGDLHERFWDEFSQKSGMEGGWKEIYPIVTDPSQFPTDLDGETKEFIDSAVGYVGYDPKETFERNVELMQQGGLSPNFSIDINHNDYKKILDAQGTLKHSFVRRDLGKIKDLSRLLGFIKGIKNGSYDADVKLNDVAAGIGVVLESKTITGTDYGNLMALVNDARISYAKMHEQMNIPKGYGLRQGVWQASVNAGQDKGAKAYFNTLRSGMEQLNTQAGSASQATIRSRVLADLAVLEHFSKTYESDVTAVLKAKGDDTFKGFRELYQSKKAEASVYEHRLGSIVE